MDGSSVRPIDTLLITFYETVAVALGIRAATVANGLFAQSATSSAAFAGTSSAARSLKALVQPTWYHESNKELKHAAISPFPRRLMNFIRSTWRLFACNMRTAILFEAGFQIAFAILFIPLSLGLIDFALYVSDLSYLCDANLAAFASHPVTWLCTLLAIITLGLGSLFEMCALVLLMQAGQPERKIGVRELANRTFEQAMRIVHPRNWLLIPFVLLLVPLTNIAVTSSVLTDFRPPEFIMDFIWENNALSIALVVTFAALYVHAFLLAFGVHFFTLQGEDWMQARTSSKSLLRGNHWVLARRILGLLALFVAEAVAAALVGLLALGVLMEGDLPLGAALGLAVVSFAFLIVSQCLLTPFSYAALSSTFYELAEKKNIEVAYRFGKHDPLQHSPLPKRATVAALGLIAFLSSMSYVTAHGLFEPSPEPPAYVEITAHRGGARTAPENTLAAFQQAIDEGADWVELDVQQTADGVLMVMHDANLKRTTGLDKNFWEVTYDEIKDLDNGSWFGPAFSGERVCTLEEALALCKDKIKMNIEVKPDGHGTDLERKTVELINRYNMRDQVVVASISYDALVRVKKADPRMPTMYDMTLAYGYINYIECVDYFSVDDFFVTQQLVNDTRKAGKTIFAWTVNDPANMQRLISYGINGLVTDDVRTAREMAENFEAID